MVHADVSGNGSFFFLCRLDACFRVVYRESVGMELLIFLCFVFARQLCLFLIDLLQHFFIQCIRMTVESNSPVFQADDAT